jgi:hypothetical protein
MHYLSSVYSFTIPLHVSGLLVADQEVTMYCNRMVLVLTHNHSFPLIKPYAILQSPSNFTSATTADTPLYHVTLQLYNSQIPDKKVVYDNQLAKTGCIQQCNHTPINFTPPKFTTQLLPHAHTELLWTSSTQWSHSSLISYS